MPHARARAGDGSLAVGIFAHAFRRPRPQDGAAHHSAPRTKLRGPWRPCWFPPQSSAKETAAAGLSACAGRMNSQKCRPSRPGVRAACSVLVVFCLDTSGHAARPHELAAARVASVSTALLPSLPHSGPARATSSSEEQARATGGAELRVKRPGIARRVGPCTCS